MGVDGETATKGGVGEGQSTQIVTNDDGHRHPIQTRPDLGKITNHVHHLGLEALQATLLDSQQHRPSYDGDHIICIHSSPIFMS